MTGIAFNHWADGDHARADGGVCRSLNGWTVMEPGLLALLCFPGLSSLSGLSCLPGSGELGRCFRAQCNSVYTYPSNLGVSTRRHVQVYIQTYMHTYVHTIPYHTIPYQHHTVQCHAMPYHTGTIHIMCMHIYIYLYICYIYVYTDTCIYDTHTGSNMRVTTHACSPAKVGSTCPSIIST